jgi:hypothetical protein
VRHIPTMANNLIHLSFVILNVAGLHVSFMIDGAKLFELMDDVLKRDFSIHGLRIHISLHGSRFTWDCSSRLSTEHGRFIVQLVHYSFIFMSKGVDIVDEDGFAISRRKL